ncbi:MAG: methyltransferase domain-containing protein [Deltaproteobacteria bacterium]|nr:methyltransferase domain-containing protein [Deltaproteobacteria bacterium]
MSETAGRLTQLKRYFQGALRRDEVSGTVEGYERHFEARAGERGHNASKVTRDFYQLATDFYEYGWGHSFHFAPRVRGETLKESITRYEHHLALRLGLAPGMRVLDVGCGVGGPMRTIARFSGAAITGVTISPYQVQRARQHAESARLTHLCTVVEADYNALPFEPEHFDAAYSIEACCHAADRRGPFGETFRALKAGGLFAGADWCTTSRYRPGDPEHERIKLGIEKGNGVSSLQPTSSIDRALQDSGFEILETRDWLELEDPATPWWSPLASGVSLKGFRNSQAGGYVTHQLVRTLETVRLAPEGTLQTHDVLRLAQRSLVEGGQTGIFTPMYFWLARKPSRP